VRARTRQTYAAAERLWLAWRPDTLTIPTRTPVLNYLFVAAPAFVFDTAHY